MGARRLRRPLAIGLALAVGSLPIACGDDTDEGAELPANAVARVGDTVLTERQVRDFAMSGPGGGQQASGRLILYEWLRREARREGLQATEARATLSASDAKTPTTVKRAEFIWLLLELLRKRSGPPPSSAAIARHYREHPELARPEVRFMRLVGTETRAQAQAARDALERRESWRAVSRRHPGGKGVVRLSSGTMGAGRGELPAGLDEALYAARRGELYGPVETDAGWYVFELTKVDPLPARSLAQARDAVIADLQEARQRRAREALTRHLLARYRPITICAEGQGLAQCHNRPTDEARQATLLEL